MGRVQARAGCAAERPWPELPVGCIGPWQNAVPLPTGDAMLFEWLLGSYLLLIDWLIRLVALCWICLLYTSPSPRDS